MTPRRATGRPTTHTEAERELTKEKDVEPQEGQGTGL